MNKDLKLPPIEEIMSKRWYSLVWDEPNPNVGLIGFADSCNFIADTDEDAITRAAKNCKRFHREGVLRYMGNRESDDPGYDVAEFHFTKNPGNSKRVHKIKVFHESSFFTEESAVIISRFDRLSGVWSDRRYILTTNRTNRLFAAVHEGNYAATPVVSDEEEACSTWIFKYD